MIKIGIRVEVPFGKQVLEGFVLEIKDSSDANCKDILSVKDEEVILNDELLDNYDTRAEDAKYLNKTLSSAQRGRQHLENNYKALVRLVEARKKKYN